MTARPPLTTRTQSFVRARAMANMTGQVRILRMVRPSMDDLTLLVTAAQAQLIYQGKARIRALQGGGMLIVGEEQISTRSTAISIPFDAPVPHVDDVVLVDSYGTDTDLATKAFLIKDVDGGGLIRAVRTLTCSVYEASRWWES